MSKLIIFLLCIVSLNNLKAQEIKYSLTLLDTCYNTVSPHYSFWIFQDTIELQNDTFPNVQAFFDENDSLYFYAIVKDTGTYYLSHGYDNGKPSRSPFHKVHLSEFGIINDTFIINNIRKIAHYLAHPLIVEYYCCTEKCNGYQVNYYENGNKQLEGHFKNGQPKGEMRAYYYTGELKEKHVYTRKYRKHEYYDLTGKMYKSGTEERLRNASELWGWKEKTTYNSAGKVIKKVVYDVTEIIEEYQFDEVGNKVYEIKKNERTDFYPNGTIKAAYNWRIQKIEFNCWKKLLIWQKDCYCCEDALDYTVLYKKSLVSGTKVEGKKLARN